MPTQDPIRVAVVGAGSFGRNHLRVYRDLQKEGRVQIVAVVDSNPDIAALAADTGAPAFRSVADMLAANTGAVAASVAVPTVLHRAVACELLAAGLDTLVEKPIASTLEDADALIAAAESGSRILQIGHLERFNPAVLAARKHINHPMFFEVHRLSVFTPRSLDVDVILDLMIHDLDLVLSMVAAPLAEVRAVGIPVLSDKTDIANVRLAFADGGIANLTASRISAERVRKMRIFQPRQYLAIDFAHQELQFVDVSIAAGLTPQQIAALAAAAAHSGVSGLGPRRVPVEQREPLRLEIESFLDSVRTRAIPQVTGRQARAALELAFSIHRSIAEHTQAHRIDRLIPTH